MTNFPKSGLPNTFTQTSPKFRLNFPETHKFRRFLPTSNATHQSDLQKRAAPRHADINGEPGPSQEGARVIDVQPRLHCGAALAPDPAKKAHSARLSRESSY